MPKKLHSSHIINKSQNKIKTTWKLINLHLNKIKTFKEINLCINNKDETNPTIIANVFNDHFVTLTENILKTKIKSTNLAPKSIVRNHKSFFLSPVTDDELKKIISSLNNTQSTGHDNIPICVYKFATDILIAPLVHLINIIFSTGVFPNLFKLAKVVPLYKSKDKKKYQQLQTNFIINFHFKNS